METPLVTPKFTVYCLAEKRRGGIRYFGVTAGPLYKRLKEHLKEANQMKRWTPKLAWIRARIKSGKGIKILRIRRCLSLEAASKLEFSLIEIFKTAFNLTNSAPGGLVKAHGKSSGGIRGWLRKRIKARIIVIIRERESKEFTFWSFDSRKERRRKLLIARRYALEPSSTR